MLPGTADLQLLSLLRVLPGSAMSAPVSGAAPGAGQVAGGQQGRPAFQRELAGVRLLAEQGLTTPLLLADGLKEGEGGWLLFEFLEGAESLADAWAAVEHLPMLADEQHAVLGEALTAWRRCTPRACGRKTCTWTTCCARRAGCT
jgi:hypothetical protein